MVQMLTPSRSLRLRQQSTALPGGQVFRYGLIEVPGCDAFALQGLDDRFRIYSRDPAPKILGEFESSVQHPRVGISASGALYAILGEDSVVVRPVVPGTNPAGVTVEIDGLELRSHCFDPGQDLLHIIGEKPDGECELVLVDPSSGIEVSRASVGGLGECAGEVTFLPGGLSLLVEISCGQDGSFISTVELKDGSYHLLGTWFSSDPVGVMRPMAQSESYYAVGSSTLHKRRLHDHRHLESMELDAGLYTSFSGAAFDDCVLLTGMKDELDYWPFLLCADADLEEFCVEPLLPSTGIEVVETLWVPNRPTLAVLQYKDPKRVNELSVWDVVQARTG